MRRITDHDSAYFAIPAGLLAGIAFSQYPDTTIALYVFWKTAQVLSASSDTTKQDFVQKIYRLRTIWELPKVTFQKFHISIFSSIV